MINNKYITHNILALVPVMKTSLLTCVLNGILFASLFFSCQNEDIPDIITAKPGIETGDPVEVNFTMREAGFGANEITVRKQASPYLFAGGERVLEEHYIPISLNSPSSGELEEAYLSVTLTEDNQQIELRSDPLEPDSKVRIVAYRSTAPNDTTTHSGYADYEVVSGGLLSPINYPLRVTPGEYKFVAYSYQDADPIPIFADTTAQLMTPFDVLWGAETVTVGPGNTLVEIEMRHLYSQVRMHVSLDSTVVGSQIEDLVNPSVSSYNPRLVVQSGKLILNGSPVMGLTPFVFDYGGSAPEIAKSHPQYIYTNNSPIQVNISSIKIDGAYYSGPYTIPFSKLLEAGKSYLLSVNFILSDGCADILYFASDSTLSIGKWKDGQITAQNLAYFKFGGVIGFRIPISNNTWADTLVMFNPSTRTLNYYEPENNGSNHHGISHYSTSDDWKNGQNPILNVSGSNYHTGTNVRTNGKGDPCKLVGYKGSQIRGMTESQINTIVSEWRLATANENIDFVRAPVSWYHTGIEIMSYPSLTSTNAAYWYPSGGQNGGWFPITGNRESTTGRTTRTINPHGFLPVSGVFTLSTGYSGNYNSVGTGGYLSSTINDSQHGLSLFFDSQSMTPLYFTVFSNGRPVRCVKNKAGAY